MLIIDSDSPLYFGNSWGVRIDKVLLGSTIFSVDLDRVQGIGQVLRHALTTVETLQSALLVLDKFAVLSLFCVEHWGPRKTKNGGQRHIVREMKCAIECRPMNILWSHGTLQKHIKSTRPVQSIMQKLT